MADIQLLFADDGNERALASLVAEQHTPITADGIQHADVYIVDEAAYPQYRDALYSHKHEEQPVFCPVVLVRRDMAATAVELADIESTDPPILVNEVLQAPVGKQVLFRTLRNLLARREQTESLTANLRARTTQLEEEREKYRTLVEQSESGIAVTKDDAFVFVNERLTEILGRDQETLLGLPVRDVVVPGYQELVQTRHEKRLAGDEPPKQYEIAILTPEGDRKDIDLRASRIEYENEQAVLVLFRDITEHKQREHELRQFKNAVEHAGHAIVVTDPNGVIKYVNPAFEEITEYPATEAVGKTPRILKSGEHDEAFYERLWGTILSGEVWNTEIVNERKSGERFVALQTIAPIVRGSDDIEGFVAIQDEITERRLREQQLEVFHRVLRHNLRNKGSVIKSLTDLVTDGVEDDTALSHLQTIDANVQSLLDISEKAQRVRQTIADTSESHSGRELQPFLEQLVEQFEATHPDAEIQLTAEPTSPVTVDVKGGPAIRELIENAVTHSDASPPRVTVLLTATETTATVDITDNGPGIPEQERHALETGSENPLQHGSGLGLWLAYWLIHYAGGTITIDTDERGTSVTVTLPVK